MTWEQTREGASPMRVPPGWYPVDELHVQWWDGEKWCGYPVAGGPPQPPTWVPPQQGLTPSRPAHADWAEIVLVLLAVAAAIGGLWLLFGGYFVHPTGSNCVTIFDHTCITGPSTTELVLGGVLIAAAAFFAYEAHRFSRHG